MIGLPHPLRRLVVPQSAGDDEVERLLMLLSDNDGAPMTIEAMRGAGVMGPAQAIYFLQLTGHAIDRVYCRSAEGQQTLGYRLYDSPPATVAET